MITEFTVENSRLNFLTQIEKFYLFQNYRWSIETVLSYHKNPNIFLKSGAVLQVESVRL
jgi:hypothetical protein